MKEFDEFEFPNSHIELRLMVVLFVLNYMCRFAFILERAYLHRNAKTEEAALEQIATAHDRYFCFSLFFFIMNRRLKRIRVHQSRQHTRKKK